MLLIRSRLTLLATVLLAFIVPQPLPAQSQATTGVLRGTVTDTVGTPLTEASVTVRNIRTNFSRTINTNSRGVYVATLLPPGDYTVSARALGYRSATRRGQAVRLGETVVVEFRLENQAV